MNFFGLTQYFFSSRKKRAIREFFARLSIQHCAGTPNIQLRDNEAAVTCLVKNGEYYIQSFIEHYLEKGFRHIFLLDNGSTDGTIPFAVKFPQVSIFQTSLSVGKYQAILKKILSQKTIKGGWCLDVDIDEFFDYPFSDRISLNQFLEYLNCHQYSAVVTQMLDLFSEKPLSHLLSKQKENLKDAYRYYDNSAIRVIGYVQSDLAYKYANNNHLSNTDIKLCFGGIRKRLYGLDCLLSKHSLFSRRHRLELFPHVHFVNKAELADVSCVLLHYKLTSNALETAIQNRDVFTGTSQGYSAFIDLITKNSEFRIVNEQSKKLEKINDLISDGFIVISDQYRDAFGLL